MLNADRLVHDIHRQHMIFISNPLLHLFLQLVYQCKKLNITITNTSNHSVCIVFFSITNKAVCNGMTDRNKGLELGLN